MPNCVVKGCKNQSSKNKKQDGITFHTFPSRDQNMKEKWIAVIRNSRNEPLWHPTSRSVVCSAHFNSEDLYYSKKGLRRVIKTRYPKRFRGIPEQLDNTDLSQPHDIHLPEATGLSNDPSLSHPTTIYAVETVVPDLQFLDVNHPSSLCAVQLDLSEQVSSNFDDPKNYKLWKRIVVLETKLKITKKKIKTLNQKVRRLHIRNKSLREKLLNIKKQNFIDTD